MNTSQAKKQGVLAYKAGMGRAPALNGEFTKQACAGASTKEVIKLLDAYMHGWTIASLADGADDAQMPSIRELARTESE